MAKNGKAKAVEKEADIKAVPEVVRSVRCTKMVIQFHIEMLENGKSAGEINPPQMVVFEKDFEQSFHIGKAVEAACAQVQQQIDGKK